MAAEPSTIQELYEYISSSGVVQNSFTSLSNESSINEGVQLSLAKIADVKTTVEDTNAVTQQQIVKILDKIDELKTEINNMSSCDKRVLKFARLRKEGPNSGPFSFTVPSDKYIEIIQTFGASPNQGWLNVQVDDDQVEEYSANAYGGDNANKFILPGSVITVQDGGIRGIAYFEYDNEE